MSPAAAPAKAPRETRRTRTAPIPLRGPFPTIGVDDGVGDEFVC